MTQKRRVASHALFLFEKKIDPTSRSDFSHHLLHQLLSNLEIPKTNSKQKKKLNNWGWLGDFSVLSLHFGTIFGTHFQGGFKWFVSVKPTPRVSTGFTSPPLLIALEVKKVPPNGRPMASSETPFLGGAFSWDGSWGLLSYCTFLETNIIPGIPTTIKIMFFPQFG